MAYVRRSPLFPQPSKIVVFGLIFLAIVGALVAMSQFGSENLTPTHYLRIAYFAFIFPGLAVGMALFFVLVQWCIGIFFGD